MNGSEHRKLLLGNLEIDYDTFRVWVGEEYVALGMREFDALALLAAEPDRVLPVEEITEALWRASGRVYSRRLSVMIYRLRHKLARSHPYSIESVRGRGYGLMSIQRTPAPPERETEHIRVAV